jgi:hypothetical protein
MGSMKKFTLLLLYALSLHAETPNPQTEPLLHILEITGMESLSDKEPMLDQMNAWAQKNLLRQGERWDEQTDRFEALGPQLKPLLTRLRFIEAISAPKENYQGALLHGASINTVRARILFLDCEWKRGVRFSRLYFLSGSRPLTSQEKAFVSLETEIEMIQWLWNTLDISQEMKSQVEIVSINCPMKENSPHKNLLRPTTEDTVHLWLKTTPPPGHYLAISNAPFIPRQDYIVQTLSPKEYSIDTIGPGAKDGEKMIIFLDEIARLLFTFKNLKS